MYIRSPENIRKAVFGFTLIFFSFQQWARVTETRETIAYVILSFLTAIFCIVLEAMVLKAHSDEASNVWSSEQQVKRPLNIAYAETWVSLTRLQNENIFFITFQIFQTYLGIDSVSNLMRLIASVATFSIFGGMKSS